MQKAVELQVGKLVLRGMLHEPEQRMDRMPMVCIYHGFTGNKMEPHFIFVKLSRLLAKRGIASVRFDFGGSGESDGEFSDMTILGELNEADSVLEFARNLQGVDPTRIALVGLSMGGAVAGMLAAMRQELVKALCLWAPAGNLGEILSKRTENRMYAPYNETGDMDVGGLLVGKGFYEEALKLDIFERSSGYKNKVLLIHGTNDIAVPFETSLRYQQLYGGQAELLAIPEGDHTFNQKHWEDVVLKHTVAFLAKELLG